MNKNDAFESYHPIIDDIDTEKFNTLGLVDGKMNDSNYMILKSLEQLCMFHVYMVEIDILLNLI